MEFRYLLAPRHELEFDPGLEVRLGLEFRYGLEFRHG